MTDVLKTIPEKFFEIAAERGPHPALIVGASGEEVSFAELAERVARVRAYLEDHGIHPRDRVVLIGVTTPAMVAALLGALSAGAVAVPLNYRLPAADLAWLVRDCEAKTLMADPRYLEVVRAEAERLKSAGRPVVGLGEPAGEWTSFAGVLATAPKEIAARTVGLDDPAFILYTSGTTARPKGVEQRHRGYAMVAATPSPIPPEKVRNLHCCPIYHLAGLGTLLAGLSRGSTQVLQDRFDAEQWLALVQRYRANASFLVPTMMSDVASFEDFADYDVSSMRLIAYGSAPTPLPVLTRLIERLPNAGLMQVYTQTEGSARVTMLGPEDHRLPVDPAGREKQLKRLTSVGKVVPGVEVRVCEPDGREVAAGEVGELWYRTPAAMSGYLGRAEDTAETIVDGWIRSGDIVRVDEDGYVYIVGRAKDFLIRGGENIAPREIEEALESHPAVREAAVVGAPHERWGEVPVAFVRCDPGSSPAEEELRSWCRDRLAGFKVPERIRVIEEFPRNSVGKILKRELVELAREPAAS